MSHQEYLHGYTEEEQDRLYRQAVQLEPHVYKDINLDGHTHLFEVGCGVGAQTKILTRRFPNLKITAVDMSEDQLSRARTHLKEEIASGQVELKVANAMDLSEFARNTFDSCFICWFLEHVPEPLKVLQEVRKRLRSHSPIVLTEINNASFFVDPYSPATLKYWFEMNDYQWSIQGHPFIGAQLGNYLLRAGFSNVQTELRGFHFDSRTPAERSAFFKSTFELLQSSSGPLLQQKRISQQLLTDMETEFDNAISDTNSAILMGWVRGHAFA